jgi:flavin-dependent dehydrogenase
MVTPDIAIVGGGPAGLAVAIVAAERGLSALVLERRDGPPDKACGEGLLPPAVRGLHRLGADAYLPPGGSRVFTGIRFIQEDGSMAHAPLPGSGGLGVRRTVLVEALARRARALGATIRFGSHVLGFEPTAEGATVRTATDTVRARLVVAADGLHSTLRRAAGFAASPNPRRRFALRQHFRVTPWTDCVEVYVDRLGEAVVTPVSDDAVNVNVVWEDGAVERPSLPRLAARFPVLQARIGEAPAISSIRSAGPMAQGVSRRTGERMVLVGDAAGFVDSISADGLSTAFTSALVLGDHLPAILAAGATEQSLRAYERAARRVFRNYWTVTSALLLLGRHPRWRQAVVHYLERHPAMCRAMMQGAMRMMLSAA